MVLEQSTQDLVDKLTAAVGGQGPETELGDTVFGPMILTNNQIMIRKDSVLRPLVDLIGEIEHQATVAMRAALEKVEAEKSNQQEGQNNV